MEEILKQLPAALLPWYETHKRDLPWRQDREAYHVWLSEIMLQQTRVEAVKGYYARFLETLPTLQALANCHEEKLLKLCEGLGYYSRVRNMKKAAQTVMRDHGGVFPRDYREVLRLPGVGEYTAGAVCSICFDLPTPAVDGNVLRVISRLLDDATPIDLPGQKKTVHNLLQKVYPPEAGEFAQALMELGATVCGPNRAPDCEACPCKAFCLAHLRGTARSLPVKLPKKGRRVEEKTVFILRSQSCYALVKRPETGLLAGLWQFPDVPGTLEPDQALETLEAMGLHPTHLHRQTDKVHIFTHVQWQMRGFYLEVREPGAQLQWIPEAQIQSRFALPTAYRQFWEERNI